MCKGGWFQEPRAGGPGIPMKVNVIFTMLVKGKQALVLISLSNVIWK